MERFRFLLISGIAHISLQPFVVREAQDGALPVTSGAGRSLPDAEVIG